MTTLVLKYVRRRKAFHVAGTNLYVGPARSDEFDEVAEYLGRRLCDNPALQAALHVLSTDGVAFAQA